MVKMFGANPNGEGQRHVHDVPKSYVKRVLDVEFRRQDAEKPHPQGQRTEESVVNLDPEYEVESEWDQELGTNLESERGGPFEWEPQHELQHLEQRATTIDRPRIRKSLLILSPEIFRGRPSMVLDGFQLISNSSCRFIIVWSTALPAMLSHPRIARTLFLRLVSWATRIPVGLLPITRLWDRSGP